MNYRKIFVYGSLMKDFFNYDTYLEGCVIDVAPAYIIGKLYHLKNKGYPGYITQGNDYVFGEIITYMENGQILSSLDDLEGYTGAYHHDNPYNRCSTQVYNMVEKELVSLDVYVYNESAPCNKADDRLYLGQGSWRKFMENN